MPLNYSSPDDPVNKLRGVPGRSWKSFAGKSGGAGAGRNRATASPDAPQSTDGPMFPPRDYTGVVNESHPAGSAARRKDKIPAPVDAWPQL